MIRLVVALTHHAFVDPHEKQKDEDEAGDGEEGMVEQRLSEGNLGTRKHC
jgi:hypothetical protein